MSIKLTESQILKKYADIVSPKFLGPDGDPNWDPIDYMPGPTHSPKATTMVPEEPFDVFSEDASTFANNAEQAKGIIFLCEKYIEACNESNEELAYDLASEIVQLALELERSEENFDPEKEADEDGNYDPEWL